MFKDFQPVLKILVRFVIIYLTLLFLYQLYLNIYIGKEIDVFSFLVANQVQQCQNFAGFPTQLYNDAKLESVWFYTVDKYTTRMVEGCNAVSVIILFVAFIFAFYKGYRTFIYAGLGILFLHIINVLRIAGLNIIYFRFPNYGKAAHDYLFPAVIYGSVVLLWLVWIKFFILKNDENT